VSHNEIAKSLELLEKDWDIDSVIKDFHLGKRDDVSENSIKIGGVVFHIPLLTKIKKFILWKCYWPDCSNCCTRQGRLPLTSDDLITIGTGMKYQKTSDFIKNETVIATWQEPSPGGGSTPLTGINLKRKEDETEADDGTHIKCRFLDEEGACGIHPTRPEFVIYTHFQHGYKMIKVVQEFMLLSSLLVTVQVFILTIRLIP